MFLGNLVCHLITPFGGSHYGSLRAAYKPLLNSSPDHDAVLYTGTSLVSLRAKKTVTSVNSLTCFSSSRIRLFWRRMSSSFATRSACFKSLTEVGLLYCCAQRRRVRSSMPNSRAVAFNEPFSFTNSSASRLNSSVYYRLFMIFSG